MSKKLYIAYGSNLNLGQMKYRCPTAKLYGTGVIENYEYMFISTTEPTKTENAGHPFLLLQRK